MDLMFLLFAAGILIIGFAVPILTLRYRNRKQNNLAKDLSTAFGMDLKPGEGKGRWTEIELTAPQDGLKLSLRPGKNGRTHVKGALGRVVATLGGPHFAGGLLVATPQVEKRFGEALATLAGGLDNPFGRTLISNIYGPEIADQIGDLQDYSADAGPDVVVLSVADPSMFFDLPALAAGVRELPWR